MSDCVQSPHSAAGDYARLRPNSGKAVAHHRLVYAQHNNISLKDMEGKVVMHTCDNPACINPAHLVLGTQQDNIKDMWSKGRQGVKGMPGAAHPMAKLTEQTVREIILATRMEGKELAAKYGVSKATISMVLNRKIWKHVAVDSDLNKTI